MTTMIAVAGKGGVGKTTCAALVLRGLGFAPVTFLLLIFLFKGIGEMDWKISIIGPLLTTSFFYLVFKVWLEVQLPEGPLGM